MPSYDYDCGRCGPFTEIRPMAEFAAPRPCPVCGEASPRALLRGPALATMDAGRRTAQATNERSAHAPRRASETRHPSGCGCCRPAAGPKVAEAVSPGKRPWMLGH